MLLLELVMCRAPYQRMFNAGYEMMIGHNEENVP